MSIIGLVRDIVARRPSVANTDLELPKRYFPTTSSKSPYPNPSLPTAFPGLLLRGVKRRYSSGLANFESSVTVLFQRSKLFGAIPRT